VAKLSYYIDKVLGREFKIAGRPPNVTATEFARADGCFFLDIHEVGPEPRGPNGLTWTVRLRHDMEQDGLESDR